MTRQDLTSFRRESWAYSPPAGTLWCTLDSVSYLQATWRSAWRIIRSNTVCQRLPSKAVWQRIFPRKQQISTMTPWGCHQRLPGNLWPSLPNIVAHWLYETDCLRPGPTTQDQTKQVPFQHLPQAIAWLDLVLKAWKPLVELGKTGSIKTCRGVFANSSRQRLRSIHIHSQLPCWKLNALVQHRWSRYSRQLAGGNRLFATGTNQARPNEASCGPRVVHCYGMARHAFELWEALGKTGSIESCSPPFQLV